ncbi:hypothetical protein E2C01_023096 [Portunus trituberculatus]|uniref:Uncharacterized protein n=1 Tax=Portunus trituberculatus TaxID=210409 RepID=A0A5B7E9H6_PORTR|nr:hypothetical protein [Portunus trituberculatus]
MLPLLQLAEHTCLLGSPAGPQVALHEQDVLTKFLTKRKLVSHQGKELLCLSTHSPLLKVPVVKYPGRQHHPGSPVAGWAVVEACVVTSPPEKKLPDLT